MPTKLPTFEVGMIVLDPSPLARFHPGIAQRPQSLRGGRFRQLGQPDPPPGDLGLLPAIRHRRIDVWPACGQRRQARESAALWRARDDRDRGAGDGFHEGQWRDGTARRLAAPSRARFRRRASACGAPPAAIGAGRLARARLGGKELPLLRQPSEIPALRHHLRREMGDCRPGRDGACQHPSAAAELADLRCRHRRRHRADARHARDPQPLPHDPAPCRRQGDQPRGRAARAREDARPVLRASGDRARHHQHVLLRGAVAHAQFGDRGDEPRVARGAAPRHVGARFRGADHRVAAVPRRELEGQGRQVRQPDLREAGRARALSRRPQVPARRRAAAPRQHARRFRSRHRLAALSRAGAAGVQGEARAGALGEGARARRPAHRHPFAWPGSRPRDHPAHLAGRESLHHRPAPAPAPDQDRARIGGARPQFQRLFRRALAVQVRDAHAAVRESARRSARPPSSPPGTPPSMWRRSTISACRK